MNMPKAVRLQREGVLPETDDPLVLELAKAWVKCCDELGVPGCGICPVSKKCQRLAAEIADATDHAFSLTEYRQFSQKFSLLETGEGPVATPPVNRLNIPCATGKNVCINPHTSPTLKVIIKASLKKIHPPWK